MFGKIKVTIWRDEANMATHVKTRQGTLLNEHGRPANIESRHDQHPRWRTVDEAVEHFVRVDAILRSL